MDRRHHCLIQIVYVVVRLFFVLILLRSAWAENSADPDPPAGAALNEEVIQIRSDGSPSVTLQTTLMHPNGPGPFPLVIMNHGSDHAGNGNRNARYHRSNAIFYFLSRGYAVAVPMMRGYAESGGSLYHFGCDFVRTASANAEDIAAVLRHLSADPRFDTRRVIVAGQSMGGLNTLGVGTLNLPNVVGLVNFNGGIRESDCQPGDPPLIEAAARLGAHTKTPSMWFYGENDNLFPTPLWKAMYSAYTHAGGRAEIQDVGQVLDNSHTFLSYPGVLTLWTSRLDKFLAGLNMPHANVNPGDLPMPFPESTNFAPLGDVNAVPYLTEANREAYRKFLGNPRPRVFVINDQGVAASMYGGFDPLGRAMSACARVGRPCGVYAVEDRVVWKPSRSESRERGFNLTLKSNQTSTVNFAVRLNPDCSARAFARIRVGQAPMHGRLEIERQQGNPRFPEGSSYAACNARQVDGIAVRYTPESGFAGSDSFSFVEQADSGSEAIFKINANVH